MSMKRVSAVIAVAATSWLGAATLALGQEARATVGGRVVDTQGAVIPNAPVDVVSNDTGVSSPLQRTQTATGASVS
jgi:hypothetical protein